jgi:hypothetical protein
LRSVVVSLLAVIGGALGGGIVAAWFGSWFDRLNAFERSRLIVLAELMGNLASHHALCTLEPGERPVNVVYSSSAWVAHRDRLAVRAQRHQDVWLKLVIFYGTVASQPRFNQPLVEEVEEAANYAVANFDLFELGMFELVPVYGPRGAYNTWRERHRRKLNASPSAS